MLEKSLLLPLGSVRVLLGVGRRMVRAGTTVSVDLCRRTRLALLLLLRLFDQILNRHRLGLELRHFVQD